jgi:hypothetical protein
MELVRDNCCGRVAIQVLRSRCCDAGGVSGEPTLSGVGGVGDIGSGRCVLRVRLPVAARSGHQVPGPPWRSGVGDSAKTLFPNGNIPTESTGPVQADVQNVSAWQQMWCRITPQALCLIHKPDDLFLARAKSPEHCSARRQDTRRPRADSPRALSSQLETVWQRIGAGRVKRWIHSERVWHRRCFAQGSEASRSHTVAAVPRIKSERPAHVLPDRLSDLTECLNVKG